MRKTDFDNPNALAIAVLRETPYNAVLKRTSDIVPSDIGMTSAECRDELRLKGGENE